MRTWSYFEKKMKQARKRYADTNTELGNMQMLFDEIWSVNERQAGERIRYLAQWNRADDTELDSIRSRSRTIVSLLFRTCRASGSSTIIFNARSFVFTCEECVWMYVRIITQVISYRHREKRLFHNLYSFPIL